MLVQVRSKLGFVEVFSILACMALPLLMLSPLQLVWGNTELICSVVCDWFGKLSIFSVVVVVVVAVVIVLWIDLLLVFCLCLCRAIQKSNCYHKEGHRAPCEYATYHYMLAFGGVQLVFSQIPDFHNMEWLSIVAAVMSFCYSTIGFGLGVAKVIGIASLLFSL